MEYESKVLKISAKIAAAALSESGKLDTCCAKDTAAFIRTLYGEILPIAQSEDYIKIAFKAAGKITAGACEEMEEPNGKTAADFFRTVYYGIASAAAEQDFDEDVYKCAARVTAASCEEMEEPDEEKASEAAEFFLSLYLALLEDEKPACNGKYTVKETESGWSFRLLAGNNAVIGVSEVYSSRAAMEKGIESVKKNAPIAKIEDLTEEDSEKVTNPKFEIYNDKAGEFRFRLKARNGEIILASEGYKAKASCENGIESVRKNSAAEISE